MVLLGFGLQQNVSAVETIGVKPLIAPPTKILAGKSIAGAYRFTGDFETTRFALSDYSIYPSGTTVKETTDGASYCGKNGIYLLSSGGVCDFQFTIPGLPVGTYPFQVQKDISGTPSYFMSPLLNIEVFDSPQPGMPKLSISPGSGNLPMTQYPESLPITVTNIDPSTAAYNVLAEKPLGNTDINYIEIGSGCDYILPGGSCQITIHYVNPQPPTSLPPSPDPVAINIQGANTYPQTFNYIIIDPTDHPIEFVPPSITFSSPTTTTPVSLQIINQDTYIPIKITGIEISGSGLSGITWDKGNCPSFPFSFDKAGGGFTTCTSSVSASQSAYGSGSITASYLQQGISKTVTGSINVNPVTIALRDASGAIIADNVAKVVPSSTNDTLTTVFGFSNEGKFIWQNPRIVFPTTPGVVFGNDGCTGSNVLPGKVCPFVIQTTNTTLPGKVAVMTVTGDNLITVSTDKVAVLKDVSIDLDDANNKHLAYQAIKVTNPISKDVHINSVVTVSTDAADPGLNLNAGIEVCGATDAAKCGGYTSTCPINSSGTLHGGTSCNIWFKAKSIPTEDLGVKSGTITVKVNETWTLSGGGTVSGSVTKDFNGSYDQSLYVAGDFAQAASNNITVKNIAKWNGIVWGSVGTGADFNSAINALNFWRGDLYVGGSFSSPGTYLASWNGSAWTNVGAKSTTALNNTVKTLTNENEVSGNLYVGGDFTAPGKSIVSYDIASWQDVGSKFNLGSNLVPPILFLKYLPDTGNFFDSPYKGLFAGGASIKGLYVFYGPNSIYGNFVPFNPFVNPGAATGVVTALTKYNEDIYIGGNFNPNQGCADCKRVAKVTVDGATPLDQGLGSGASNGGSVNAMIIVGDYLFVGGVFRRTYDSATTLNNIGRWGDLSQTTPTPSWSALSGGLTVGGAGGQVTALTSLNGKVYIGGKFSQSNGSDVGPNIVGWDTNLSTPAWVNFGGVQGGGGAVNDILIAPSLTITAAE